MTDKMGVKEAVTIRVIPVKPEDRAPEPDEKKEDDGKEPEETDPDERR